jgi:hypothetical protein
VGEAAFNVSNTAIKIFVSNTHRCNCHMRSYWPLIEGFIRGVLVKTGNFIQEYVV